MKTYAGIGSEKTPPEICSLFKDISLGLGKAGYTLRTGRYKGADRAFEDGCDSVKGLKEVYIPWQGFGGSISPLVLGKLETKELAYKFTNKYFEPFSEMLGFTRRKYVISIFEIMGVDLKSPIDFVLAWDDGGIYSGVCNLTIKIASLYKIPVFNAKDFETENEARIGLVKFLRERK